MWMRHANVERYGKHTKGSRNTAYDYQLYAMSNENKETQCKITISPFPSFAKHPRFGNVTDRQRMAWSCQRPQKQTTQSLHLLPVNTFEAKGRQEQDPSAWAFSELGNKIEDKEEIEKKSIQ